MRPVCVPSLRLLGLAALLTLGLASIAQATAGVPAGPAVLNCAKVQKAACLKQNKANRIAFNQIKNSTFVGTRGDGEPVEETYCANGRYRSDVGGGISTGSRWQVSEAVVSPNGKSITAFVEGSGGFEIALLRRGSQWQVAVASLGRAIDPGNVTRSDATATCRKL